MVSSHCPNRRQVSFRIRGSHSHSSTKAIGYAFWRKTFYGNITDNGHFYYRMVCGDFTTQLKVSGQYHDLYDQAGLMVRIDPKNRMKCGVEFVEGKQNMSIVCTREHSSWATGRLPDQAGPLWLKVARKGPALDIFHSLDGKTFTESGVGYLENAKRLW